MAVQLAGMPCRQALDMGKALIQSLLIPRCTAKGVGGTSQSWYSCDSLEGDPMHSCCLDSGKNRE